MAFLSMLGFELPNASTIVLLVACFLLIVGILGGGMEVKEIKIPPIEKTPRIIAGLTGVILLGLSLSMMTPAAPTSAPPSDHQVQQPGLAADVTYGSRHESGSDEPYFMTRELTYSDLKDKNYLTVNEIKNEIYARHGRRFIDPKIQSYFSSQAWYKPIYSPQSFPVSLLTDVQQKNVAFLSSAERGMTH